MANANNTSMQARLERVRRSVAVALCGTLALGVVAVIGAPSASASASIASVPPTAAATVITGATPTITGIARVGCKLTAVTGTWTPASVTLSYQWRRNGTPILGAIESTYRATPADAGANLSVAITGRRTGSTAVTKVSTPTNRITAGVIGGGTPVVYGYALVGGLVGVDASSWTPGGISFSVQWNRDGVPIAGATGELYAPRPLDRGTRLTATVTGTVSGYATRVTTSAPSAAIDFGQFAATDPVILGSLTVGSTVSAYYPSWTPYPESMRFQWFRDGYAIGGATGSNYALQTADAGRAITVQITGMKRAYATAARTSGARTDWQWVTRTETYAAWDLFHSCISLGDSFEPCDQGWLFVSSSGVRLYSSGFGDVMTVVSGAPMTGSASRWRITFNHVYKPDASTFFLYSATGARRDPGQWEAQMGFPMREIHDENFTTPWSSLVWNGGAVFAISSLDWGSLYFESVTIEYDTIL